MHARLRMYVFIFSIALLTIVTSVALGHKAPAASGETATCKSSLPCLVERNGGTGAGIVAGGVYGPGVRASSRQSSAVFGQTFNPTSINFNTAAGVWGADDSTDQGGGGNSGVMGTTTYGNGVFGATYNPSLTTKVGTDAVVGVDQGDGMLNVGVHGIAVGTAVLAVSLAPQQPAGQTQYPALAALCTGGSLAMTADNGYGSPGGDVMSLDCAGNMILKGTIVTQGTPLIRVGRPNGQARAAYAAEQTQPAIEDDGEARIANGSGYVSVDGAFAEAADLNRGYSVFVTPEGPNQGLYVANKSAAGFAVRENPGGHSSIGFAYRIVATPVGAPHDRLPSMASVTSALYREAALAPHDSTAVRALLRRLKIHR
jgi:hypothetical protein